jgi:hypothetical protein
VVAERDKLAVTSTPTSTDVMASLDRCVPLVWRARHIMHDDIFDLYVLTQILLYRDMSGNLSIEEFEQASAAVPVGFLEHFLADPSAAGRPRMQLWNNGAFVPWWLQPTSSDHCRQLWAFVLVWRYTSTQHTQILVYGCVAPMASLSICRALHVDHC